VSAKATMYRNGCESSREQYLSFRHNYRDGYITIRPCAISSCYRSACRLVRSCCHQLRRLTVMTSERLRSVVWRMPDRSHEQSADPTWLMHVANLICTARRRLTASTAQPPLASSSAPASWATGCTAAVRTVRTWCVWTDPKTVRRSSNRLRSPDSLAIRPCVIEFRPIVRSS